MYHAVQLYQACVLLGSVRPHRVMVPSMLCGTRVQVMPGWGLWYKLALHAEALQLIDTLVMPVKTALLLLLPVLQPKVSVPLFKEPLLLLLLVVLVLLLLLWLTQLPWLQSHLYLRMALHTGCPAAMALVM